MFALLAGVAAGLLHVVSGPDHLAAVAPLAVDSERKHWKTGLQWGVGHTAGVLLIALLLLLLRARLPLEAISAYSERLVGLSLILVGVWAAWRAMRPGAGHAHSHAGASFAMGTLHGLAGSSHLFGVLPALAFDVTSSSVLYLAGFGFGAIAGMSAFAAGMGLISTRFGHGPGQSCRGLLYASSAAALVVGGLWLVQQ